MRDVDLSLRIRQAMARPKAAEASAPAPAAARGDHPPAEIGGALPSPAERTPPTRRRSWRGRLFGWLYPIADYVRRFVQAQVSASIEDWRGQAEAREEARFSALSGAQARFSDAQALLLERIATLGEQITASDNRIATVGEYVEAAAAAAEQRSGELKLNQDRAEVLVNRLTEELRAALGDVGVRQAGHSAALAELAAQIEGTHRDVTGLLALAGPRFDELEIKVRPLIAFDEASYAVRLADGYAMTPRSEPTLTLMIANAPSGGLESGTRRVLQALIQPGMRVADVGANIGLLTLACARAAGPAGQVWAFEPEPGPREQLEKTVALNGLRWVTIGSTAVGSARAQATFHASPIIGHSSLYALPPEEAAGERTFEVEVAPLDELVPHPPLDVVKIDVEGAELDVLKGMEGHLVANPDIAVVAEFGPSHLARVGTRPQDWWAAFKAQGLRAFAIEEPHGLCRPIRLAEALRHESINLVFVRPRSRALARLPRA